MDSCGHKVDSGGQDVNKKSTNIIDGVGEYPIRSLRMSYYVPIFSKIVDSSLWTEPDFVVKVFITMLAKTDRDNICRGNAFNIAQWSKKTEAEVIEALKILASPDTRRLEPQEFEGRRSG